MLFSFILTCLVVELTPGPNMAYLAVLSADRGRWAGYAATLGIALGLSIVGAAAAMGLAAVISNSPILYQLLRWAGVLYLLMLAREGWMDGGAAMSQDAGEESETSKLFARGLLTNLLNPKAAMFYISVLPTFVDEARPVLGQTLLLSLVYVLIASTIHAAIVTLAGAARPFLENSRRSQLPRRGLALALAAIALWFAYGSAR